MAIDSFNSTPIGGGSWRISWTSDLGGSPTFYVYRDGALISTQTEASIEIFVAVGESVHLEVFDAEPAITPQPFPTRLLVQWRDVPGATHYRIERYISAVWTTVGSVPEDGLSLYQWESDVLADDTSHDLRVVVVDTNGNESTATTLSALLVRHPDAPVWSSTYASGTKKITITAA